MSKIYAPSYMPSCKKGFSRLQTFWNQFFKLWKIRQLTIKFWNSANMPGTYRNLQDVPKNLLKTTKTKLLGENKESHFKTIVFDIYFSLTSKKEVKDLGQLFKKRRLPHTQQKRRDRIVWIFHILQRKNRVFCRHLLRGKSRGHGATLHLWSGRMVAHFFFADNSQKRLNSCKRQIDKLDLRGILAKMLHSDSQTKMACWNN